MALVESVSVLGGQAMRVAITGGTGFVCRHLARGLVARGHQAVLLARGKDVRVESIYSLAIASFV